MAVTAVQQASALLSGKSPIPGYIAPGWDEQTPLADWLVAAGVVGHYLGDVSTGIRQPIDLTSATQTVSYVLRVHDKGVQVASVLTDLSSRTEAPASAGVEVHAFKLGKHTMLLCRLDGTVRGLTDPLVYRNGNTQAPMWSLIPTEIGAIPQSSTSGQLLSALHALHSPGCAAGWAWANKVAMNQTYTLRALAGLGLVLARGTSSVLTPAGRGLLSAGPAAAEARLADLLDQHALTVTHRAGGRNAVESLLSSLDKGEAMQTRPSFGVLSRRISDIADWSSWSETIKAGDTPAGPALPRATVTALPGKSYADVAADALLERMKVMDPVHFEHLVAHVAAAEGLSDIATTLRSGDKGVDVAAKLRTLGCEQDVVIQAKRFKQNVQTPVIREMRGTGPTCAMRIVVTTAGFSGGAIAEAANSDRRVHLIDGVTLARFCVRHEIGVELVDGGYELTDLTEFAA